MLFSVSYQRMNFERSANDNCKNIIVDNRLTVRMAEGNAEFAQIWADAFSLYQDKTKRQVDPRTLMSSLRS